MPHHPSRYERYRPLYPPELFEPLARALPAGGSILDLGCGTGQSAESLLAALPQASLTLVDSDPGMITLARSRPRLSQAQTRVAQAETTGLPQQSFDAILIGSALHWMNIPQVAKECARVLRPGGIVYVFEYQFPKAVAPELAPLNEMIRREFNLRWKAPAQKPRGSLNELLSPFSTLNGWEKSPTGRVPMRLALDLESLAGLLFSQSRYLDFEATLPDEPVRALERDRVRNQIASLWKAPEPSDFDFNLQAASLRLGLNVSARTHPS